MASSIGKPTHFVRYVISPFLLILWPMMSSTSNNSLEGVRSLAFREEGSFICEANLKLGGGL